MSEYQQVGSGRQRIAARRRGSLVLQWLDELLATQLAIRGSGLQVVDLGGGTGGTAAALAEAGHTVAVVDPSPDSLAATERRATEAQLADRLTAVQGDTATLAQVIPAGSADVVVCHRVLERRADVADALRAIAVALKPDGLLSILIDQRLAQVLQLASDGHFDVARETLLDPELLDRPGLLAGLAAGGWQVLAEHGVGCIADHIPEAAAEGQAEALLDLEATVAGMTPHLESATCLHVLASRAEFRQGMAGFR